ncbi:hypothetical protein MCEMIH16_01351 [Caulobacteraceae bacterium]
MSAVVPMTTARRLDRADGLQVAERRYLIDPTDTPWKAGSWADIMRLTDGYAPQGQSWCERVREGLALAPSGQEVADYLARMKEADSTAPDPRASIIMVGMLVDAFPNSRASGAFIDAATHDAVSMGFTPYHLATACQKLRRTSKFLPSIAEFLAECASARKHMQSAISLAERMQDRIEQARLALAHQGDTNEPRP